ncbi:hypothetical protein [Desulfosporosinus fructosivorans]
MEDNSIEQHKQCKDMILKALYDNRGKKQSSASDIRHMVDIRLKLQIIEVYLSELIDQKMVKKDTIKSPKITNFGAKSKQMPSIPSWNEYRILPLGIEYVENGFNKPIESQSDISKIAIHAERQTELLSSLVETSHLSLTEQQKQNELMSELKDALQSNDDGKARNILKEGLDAGKQVALPLMVEYFKSLFIPGA